MQSRDDRSKEFGRSLLVEAEERTLRVQDTLSSLSCELPRAVPPEGILVSLTFEGWPQMSLPVKLEAWMLLLEGSSVSLISGEYLQSPEPPKSDFEESIFLVVTSPPHQIRAPIRLPEIFLNASPLLNNPRSTSRILEGLGLRRSLHNV